MIREEYFKNAGNKESRIGEYFVKGCGIVAIAVILFVAGRAIYKQNLEQEIEKSVGRGVEIKAESVRKSLEKFANE